MSNQTTGNSGLIAQGFQASLILDKGQRIRQEIPIKLPLLVGRGSHCDLIIKHKSVSREHCVISAQGEGLEVEDLGSSNGTLIDKIPIIKQAIDSGQLITIGPLIFRLIYSRVEGVPSGDLLDTETPIPTLESVEERNRKKAEAGDPLEKVRFAHRHKQALEASQDKPLMLNDFEGNANDSDMENTVLSTHNPLLEMQRKLKEVEAKLAEQKLAKLEEPKGKTPEETLSDLEFEDMLFQESDDIELDEIQESSSIIEKTEHPASTDEDSMDVDESLVSRNLGDTTSQPVAVPANEGDQISVIDEPLSRNASSLIAAEMEEDSEANSGILSPESDSGLSQSVLEEPMRSSEFDSAMAAAQTNISREEASDSVRALLDKLTKLEDNFETRMREMRAELDETRRTHSDQVSALRSAIIAAMEKRVR